MSNSTAILLAGAMLALALFFGLRSRTAGPIDAPAATPPAEPLHPPAAPPAAPALDPAAARARTSRW